MEILCSMSTSALDLMKRVLDQRAELRLLGGGVQHLEGEWEVLLWVYNNVRSRHWQTREVPLRRVTEILCRMSTAN